MIDVPDYDARKILFKNLFGSLVSENGGIVAEKLDYDHLASLTDGYSGSDINLVCREAAMRPLRSIFDKLDSPDTIDGEEILKQLSMTQEDVMEAIKTTKSSSNNSHRDKYNEWQESFGSV